MMRRFNASMLRSTRGTPMMAPSSSRTVQPVRHFHSIYNIIGSCLMCGACMLCFGSWANNYCNVKKYGRWRFRNSIDDVIMVSDFRGARYFGALIGFVFWWFVVAPQKYRWNSNLGDIPGNTRIGPF